MKVSFVIPTFNAQTWIPHAVTSCLEQTHKSVEVVVVNDGSTDRTHEYLDWLDKNEKRAKVLHPGHNIGRSAARNFGNENAQGEIICVLDADDIATPNRADLMVKKFRDGVDYIYGAATVIDILGRPIQVLGADVFDMDKAVKELQNRIVHSTAAYTHNFAKRFPYRNGEISKLGIDDWAQQIEARASLAKFDFVSQRLACYRILESQITRHRDEKAVKEAKEKFLAGLYAPA